MNKEIKEKSAKVFNNQWILKKKVSSGSFGVVFIGQDRNTKELVAIKLEKEDNEDVKSLEREVQIFNKLQGCPQTPRLYWNGQESNYNIMVLSLLGRDLAYYMKQHKKLSVKTVLMLIDQLIPILENLHSRSVIHRDLKPENLLMGRDQERNLIYMIDFGISKIYRDHHGKHIPFREKKPFIGTTRYASIAAHQGYELGRKDDLESLGYVVVFLIKGQLPWQNLQNVSDRDKTEAVGDLKVKIKPQDLCKDLPIEFTKYFEYVRKLSFKMTPDYKYLKNLFLRLGQSLNVKYFTNDFDWNIQEREQQKMQQQLLANQNGLLIPPDPNNRGNQRNSSLTPSQISGSRRASNSSFMSVMSQNSVYIKYQPQNSMYKPNSQMNYDEQIFDQQQEQYQQKQLYEESDSQDNKQNNQHIKKQNKVMMKSKTQHEEQKHEDSKAGTSSLYCNLDMDEWQNNKINLDKKFKSLQMGGVKAQIFPRKSKKYSKPYQ